jgi:sterol desaturase/sphingolipid hydroxylase (fatty acid hydroxylase superfamily)
MSDFLLAHESVVRTGIFICVLTIMAALEIVSPRRRVEIPRLLRWSNNIAMVVVDTIVVRLAFPLTAVGLADLIDQKGWGLLHLLPLPSVLQFVIAVLLFDVVIYAQHVLFHAVPMLWRLHRVHHADVAFDVTTALRFHPLEILLSMLIKFAAILLLGPPAVAVLAFEVLLNGSAMFNHSNLRLPSKLDKFLRLFVVTPDMHRVHHSVLANELNSNFGFNVPWWDRAFGTYLNQPREGHVEMSIGLDRFREPRELWLDRLLTLPFRRK